MKKENISDALDMLDEEFIAHAAEARTRGGVRKMRLWVSVGAAAACLGLLAVLASPLVFGTGKNQKDGMEIAGRGQSSSQEDSMYAEGGKTAPTVEPDSGASSQNEPEKPDSVDDGRVIQPVLIASLLGTGDGVSFEMGQRTARIPIGKYQGYYEQVGTAVPELVSQSLGKGVSGADGWYLVKGHQDLQYLIRQEDEGCTLWKFRCFDSEEYPYRDVLEQVYQVYSAKQLTQYTVLPPKFDNTDRGMKVQREIGTTVVDDRTMIDTLYEVLSSLTCCGMNHWELIDYGFGDVDVDGNAADDRDGMRLGRYLTITTTDGNEIDGLKYTAVSDSFYEFCGIAYKRLAEEQADRAWSVIGLMSGEASEGK